MDGSDLVYLARTRAGMTQAELAAASGVAQHAISRLERGHVATRFETVRDLVRACGYELDISLATLDDSMARDLRRTLSRAPADRLGDALDLARAAESIRGASGVV